LIIIIVLNELPSTPVIKNDKNKNHYKRNQWQSDLPEIDNEVHIFGATAKIIHYYTSLIS